MSVDSISNVTPVTPQFKAASVPQENNPAPELKKNGNALLYGSLAVLALAAAGGIAYACKRGRINPTKFKDLKTTVKEGKVYQNDKLFNKDVVKTTDKGKVTQVYKDGILTETKFEPKEGDYKLITRKVEKLNNGDIKTTTTKVKKDGTKETPIEKIRSASQVSNPESGAAEYKTSIKEGDKTVSEISTTIDRNGTKAVITKKDGSKELVKRDIEYAVDKDGKVISQDGYPVLKSEKGVYSDGYAKEFVYKGEPIKSGVIEKNAFYDDKGAFKDIEFKTGAGTKSFKREGDDLKVVTKLNNNDKSEENLIKDYFKKKEK